MSQQHNLADIYTRQRSRFQTQWQALLSLAIIDGQQFSYGRRRGRHAVGLEQPRCRGGSDDGGGRQWRHGRGRRSRHRGGGEDVAAIAERLLLEVVAVAVVGAAADGDLEVEQDEQVQLQLVHLRVAHAAHAREEGVAVVAA